MRGLNQFVKDIRRSRTPEQEKKRVNKELAHIREKFTKKMIRGYDRKKYVAKLLLISLLGYEVEFGHDQMIELTRSNIFSEKRMGFIAIAFMLDEHEHLIKDFTEIVNREITSGQTPGRCLALSSLANLIIEPMAKNVAPRVQKLFTSRCPGAVTTRATIVIHRYLRFFPSVIDVKVILNHIPSLFERTDVSVINAASILLLGIVRHIKKNAPSPDSDEDNPDPDPSTLLPTLDSPPFQSAIRSAILVNLIRLIREYPEISDSGLKTRIISILNHIVPLYEKAHNRLKRAEELMHSSVLQRDPGAFNAFNAAASILSEGIRLTIAHDITCELSRRTQGIISTLISSKQTNIRYVGLETLAHIASQDNAESASTSVHKPLVMRALHDADITIRRRAIDVLFHMCDKESSREIVSQLFAYLERAAYSVREELVIRISLLAEKFADTDDKWYVDTLVHLISTGGDALNDEIWFRLLGVLRIKSRALHKYACKSIFSKLQEPAEVGSTDESYAILIKSGAYILGEYGHLVADSTERSIIFQFQVLLSKFYLVNNATKIVMLHAFAKMASRFNEVKPQILSFFDKLKNSVDAEIQQRVVEYLLLFERPNLINAILWENGDSIPIAPTSVDSTPSQDASPSQLPPEVNTQTSSSSGLGDLGLGLGEPEILSGSPASKPEIGADISDTGGPIPLNNDNFIVRLLVNGTSGIIFQDANFQIGFKANFVQTSGQVDLYYGNMSNSIITSIKVSSQAVPGFEISHDAPPTSLNPGDQTPQRITVTSVTSDQSSFPKLFIQYSHDGTLYQLTLSIPIITSRFSSPLALTGPNFIKRWQLITDSNLHANLNVPLPPSLQNPISLKGLLSSPNALNFAIVPDLCTETRLVAAGISYYIQSKPQGSLIFVESTDSWKSVKILVRATDPNLSQSVIHSFKSLFS